VTAVNQPRLEIEYCTQCRWLPRAAWLAQELLTTFERELGEVALVPGTGGVLVVRVDGETVWDRKQQGFPEPTEVKQAVRPHRPRPGPRPLRPLGPAPADSPKSQTFPRAATATGDPWSSPPPAG
jgi:selenoprotein W-related protein